jgi:hypothetical protein
VAVVATGERTKTRTRVAPCRSATSLMASAPRPAKVI